MKHHFYSVNLTGVGDFIRSGPEKKVLLVVKLAWSNFLNYTAVTQTSHAQLWLKCSIVGEITGSESENHFGKKRIRNE